MSTHRVVVTYSAPQSFLSSDQWIQLRDALSAQLPLRNIHWKPQTLPSIRTIQELEVQLVPLNTVRDENTSQVPYSLLERPLLNIYVVTCEDSDAYKTTVKKQIKDWQTSLSHRKNQEWVIVHVVRSDARNAATNFFQIRSNVLDKIRADFNTDKKDRCVQLAWPVAKDNPAAWAELLSKVKDGILSAFDTAVSQRDDEVRRSESQQSMPGWNFCTFFILKESLAASFEGMNLSEDALRCYDELESSFAHVLREKNLSWFGTLIIPGPKDDSLPLLSITKKPYRDLIVANTVSVFDLRIYILAKQCNLLGMMGKVTDICNKVAMFLSSFGSHLRGVSAILPSHFIESWTYSSALSAVEQVDVWAKDLKLEGILLNQFNACKGELLELARNQLDVFGIHLGLLPSRPPFALSLPSVPIVLDGARQESRSITNSEFLKCLEDQAAFYDIYVKMTNRAIDAYVKAGRRKFALRLHGSLAALDVHRDRSTTALQTYSSLPAHYAPHKWTSLESYMLSQALNVHVLAGTNRDKQWVNIALSYLKVCESELLTSQEDSATYITNLVDSLKAAVAQLSEPLSYPEHPALSVRVLDTTVVPAGDEDGHFLHVSVLNSLPCPLPANEINVSLSGRESDKLRFSTEVNAIEPGTSTFRLFCPSSSWGTYVLERTEVVVSNLLLQWNHRPIPKSSTKASRTKYAAPTLIRLVKDTRAFDVVLKRPRSVELGPGMFSKLLLAISSGRNHIVKATFKLSGPQGVAFRFQDSALDSDGAKTLVSLERTADSISMLNLAENSEVSILIPHSVTALDTMQITIHVAYNTKREPSVSRSLSQSSIVQASLPVTVNVQDLFRGERLFSRFTISATAQQYIRVSSATLEIEKDEPELSIFGTLSKTREIITITPTRPAHYLFELVSRHSRVLDPLNLCIKYRMLRDEVETVLGEAVDEALDEFPEHGPERVHLIAHMIRALESDSNWVELYGITGELKVPASDDDATPKEVTIRIREILEKGRPAAVRSCPWREIRIHVDVPLMDILAAVRFRILATPFSGESTPPTHPLPPLYAGQPIPALLSIQTSFHWGTKQAASLKSYQMRFDVEEMVRDWLIGGRKRGDFEATDGSTLTIPMTLIALHHGELSLPNVVVTPKPLNGQMIMGSLALPNIDTHQVYGAEKRVERLHNPIMSSAEPEQSSTSEKQKPSFGSLGLIQPLLEAIERVGYKTPTDIQLEALPPALQGRDIIGVASTGSGKTAAFALPILQKLWDEPKGLFACVLAPTRELAYQISQQFEALGSAMGVRCIVLVGGMDMVTQSIALAKRPHIVVATPGRLKDHLENTKGFSLRGLRFLVLDEADRLLDMDFGPDIDGILKAIPKERTTYLFSATMTTKVAKLQRASLSNPVRIEVSTKYSTVSTLLQYYLFIPLSQKDVHLVYLANSLAQNSIIVFTRTVHDAQRLSIILRNLGFAAIPLHGQLSQSQRLGSLSKFQSGSRNILVATDVASRGLDIPAVDVIINFDIPTHSKDYIHRVGRTARAGRAGKSITLVTQYDVELIQRIEAVINKKLDLWPTDKEEIALLRERVDEAGRLAATELREEGGKKGHRKRRKGDGEDRDVRDRDDDVIQAGMPTRKKKGRR